MSEIIDGIRQFNLAGAHHYRALAAAAIPFPEGDTQLSMHLLVRTDDPAARAIDIALTREALAGLVVTVMSIEKASATGEINDIAAALHLAKDVDAAVDDSAGGDDQ